MKLLKLKNAAVMVGTVVGFVSMASADIEYSLKARVRQDLAIGAVGSGVSHVVMASGIIEKVELVQITRNGVVENVVAVTFNESKAPSGDIVADAIYFTGADAPLGMSLAGSIGKKIRANSQDRSVTVTAK